jgi:uncharacterized protein (DUF1778 family)
MADVKKRRKPKAMRKEADIRIRVTDEQKERLIAAAQRAGIGVSSWLLTLGLREAQKTGGGAGN